MTLPKTDFIIIGGGIVGLFHAYHALEMGYTVRLFEKNNEPQGATVRNFGQVVPSGMNKKWQTYGRRSLEIYKDLQSKVDLTFRNNGTVYLASDEDEVQLLDELAQINKNNSYPSVLMNKQACLEKFNGLRSDYCRGGLYFPEELTVESRKMIPIFIAYLVHTKGLLFHHSSLIREILEGETCTVEDQLRNKYEASKVILCGGHEFQTLYPELFYQSDLQVTKLQMLMTVPQPTLRVEGNILTGLTIRRYESFEECPSYASIKTKEDKNAYWKKWGIHILFKQSPDGSFIIGDSHEYADARDADDLGFDLHQHINTYMIQEAAKIFNLEDWSIQKSWAGIYSQCKDQDVFLQKIGKNVHIVTGIGGKGMTASAGFAEENLKKNILIV